MPYPASIILPFAVIFGLCMGSFGSVLAYRLPIGKDFIHGKSVCPACGKRLAAFDLVPLFSFIFLGGKCRYCKTSIPVKYPLMELAAAALSVLAFLHFGFELSAVSGFLFLFILLVITVIDGERMIIPDSLILSLIPVVIVHTLLVNDIGWQSRLLGMIIISLPMFLTAFLIKDAFGGGDIKLALATGFMLGFSGTLLMGFIAAFLGGIAGIYVKYVKRSDKTHIAFGPWLCIGTAVSFLAGKRLIDWYLAIFHWEY